MRRFHTPAICLRGHIIELKSEENGFDKKCTQCGSDVINQCPNCEAPIRGHETDPYAFMAELNPKYCHECGEPYPWTKAFINELTTIINDEYAFSDEEKEILVSEIPYLIEDGPGTQLAILRFQKACASAGKMIGSTICQFIINEGCESAKEPFQSLLRSLMN